jgi:hypothetical protein
MSTATVSANEDPRWPGAGQVPVPLQGRMKDQDGAHRKLEVPNDADGPEEV